MSIIRKFVVYRFGIATAILVLIGATVFAQEADEEPASDSEEFEEIEEIIVVSPRPGARKRVDQEYEDPVRAQLLKDFYKMQEDQEEFEWRKSAAEEDSSRITWGYDPKDEYRMRNEMDLQELPSERTRPATVFRFDF
jgi:hypothetical protein